uniref:Reverse transcriptase n=1 Tax=Leptobrachium leishanense TaxID=445787 RepID=A0A8C5PDV9_9ANUR
MKYLGVWLANTPDRLYAENFGTLFATLSDDLRFWKTKMLSWIGRINVLKMNVLPRLLFLFQALPILLPATFFRSLRSLFTRFIWPTRSSRLQYRTLALSKQSGGLALPDMKWYYYASHLTRIVDWMSYDSGQRWQDLETALSGIALWAVPWIRKPLLRHRVVSATSVSATLAIWHSIRSKFALSSAPSPLLPLIHNPDFPGEISKSLREKFTDEPRFQVRHVLRDGQFVDITLDTSMPCSFLDTFHYHRLRLYLRRLPGNSSLLRPLTPFEKFCAMGLQLDHSISALYKIIQKADDYIPTYMGRWERELDMPISTELWTKTLQLTHKGTRISALVENSFKIISFWYRSPLLMARISDNGDPSCWRNCSQTGSYLHIWWTCPRIRIYWTLISTLLTKLTDHTPQFNPEVYLLLQVEGSISGLKRSILLRVLLCARALVPRHWRSPSLPSISELVTRVQELRLAEETLVSSDKTRQAFHDTWYYWDTTLSTADFCAFTGEWGAALTLLDGSPGAP